MKCVLLVLMLWASSVHAQEERLQLVLGVPPAPQRWMLDAQGRVEKDRLPDGLLTPLGSIWKLFVYDYLVSHQLAENPYTCSGQNREEVYCCETGKQIERDAALVKSCGLYFEPQRWNITPVMWKNYWSANTAFHWLRDLNQLQSDTQVSVAELLQALSLMPSQEAARQVLLDKLVFDTPLQMTHESWNSAPLAATLGSRLRIKTWSWHDPDKPGQRIGGFAGWLVDGTPVWASGAGTSQPLLTHFAPALDHVLPVAASIDPQPCVEVALFDRYTIKTVKDTNGNVVFENGPLHGRYTVTFDNENSINIDSRGDLFFTVPTVSTDNTAPRLLARLDHEEYIARVLDREAAAIPQEAAKALAVAARTYLLQNASRQGACLQINDSSHHQRVAPRSATAESRRIAQWTAELVLAGDVVTYHQSKSGPSRLSWTLAKAQAVQGWRYDAILAHAFPRANLARWDNPRVSCEALPEAQQWLVNRLPAWREQLDREPGYQETRQFTVCRLWGGKAYIDRSRRQIHIRRLLSLQDRLDLTHEYLHLAFEAHPGGQDEHYVESLARRLLLD